LESFIAEVLDYSRTNRKELDAEKIDLRGFIEDIISDFKYLDNFEQIGFEMKLDQPYVSTDRFLFKVILSNIISNAIKYQKTDGTSSFIRISSKEENGWMKIWIEDNGEGIAREYQERIFEMFYRGSNTSTGSGLGLYITKEAVEKLNGKIELTSEAGKGSTFTIMIPLPAQV